MILTATDTATVAPIGIGAALGAVGAIAAILHAGPAPDPQRRFVARLVTAAYVGITALCLAAAIAVDDAVFIVVMALVFCAALGGAVVSFRR